MQYDFMRSLHGAWPSARFKSENYLMDFHDITWNKFNFGLYLSSTTFSLGQRDAQMELHHMQNDSL
jgi:hypothetical protein